MMVQKFLLLLLKSKEIFIYKKNASLGTSVMIHLFNFTEVISQCLTYPVSVRRAVEQLTN